MLAQRVLGRELHAGPIHARPFVAEFRCEGRCSGTVMNNPGLTGTPAFAAEYSKVYNDCKLLAIADEEGFVSIVDTSAELPTEMADDWGPNKPRAQWLAHRNAVFDIAWCNDDSQMLTASGDQTISLWDTGHADLLASFRGHSGSVKTVAPSPAAPSIFASGARDGALLVWDARVAARSDANTGQQFHSPVVTIQDAHALSEKQKRRRTPLQGRTRPSVTSLAFLHGDGSQLATGGVDGIVKFWDLRQAGGGATGEAAPAMHLSRLCDASVPHISQKQHGITSLALHPQGSQLLVSLMGGHHLVYDPLRPSIGPTRWFGGHTVTSFYVKAAWSPDGTHIISGSTDRSAYIWEVDAPDGASPYVLPGHQGEVTAVAWCPTDFHQIATTADDATVRVWTIQRQQPEEQADDGSARLAWVYPWQQQRQLQAAAAAAAAYDDAARAEAATPGPSSPPPASSGADGTPWALGSSAAGSGGGTSLLRAARSEGTVNRRSALGAARAARGGDENSHANLRPQQAAPAGADAQRQQQQQQRRQAGAAPQPQQQRQHELRAQGSVPGMAGAAGRLPPSTTPYAAAAAPLGAPASTTPAGRATAGGSGRPMRRLGDLLQAAPSTRRANKQTSITCFLGSPAGTRKRGSREPPAAASAAAGDRVSPLPLPLPGLGGSKLPLPSPRSKRMRVSFCSPSAANPAP